MPTLRLHFIRTVGVVVTCLLTPTGCQDEAPTPEQPTDTAPADTAPAARGAPDDAENGQRPREADGGGEIGPTQPEATTADTASTETDTGQRMPRFAPVHTPLGRFSGNRYYAGSGRVPRVQGRAIEVGSAGTPAWIVGAARPGPPDAEGGTAEPVAVWVVVDADGGVRAFEIDGKSVRQVTASPEELPAGMPPALQMSKRDFRLLTPPTEQASELTTPLVLPSADATAWVRRDGGVALQTGESSPGTIPVDALEDGRLVTDGDGNIAILGARTDRYAHGVLGDRIEAGRIAIIDAERGRLSREVQIPGPAVVEGLAPIWADIDEDGIRDLIVTVSDSMMGARIVAYRTDGQVVADSKAIGMGNRWRHQIAVAPFGPDRQTELVEVRTPHIGGTVEFLRADGEGNLPVVASLVGYSTHSIGSRALDLGLGGDFDGDGQPEVVVPNQAKDALAGIAHRAGGAEEVWRVELDGTLATNVAAIRYPDGRLALAAATEDDTLRVWGP